MTFLFLYFGTQLAIQKKSDTTMPLVFGQQWPATVSIVAWGLHQPYRGTRHFAEWTYRSRVHVEIDKNVLSKNSKLNTIGLLFGFTP